MHECERTPSAAELVEESKLPSQMLPQILEFQGWRRRLRQKADLLVPSCSFCCLNLDDAGRQAQLLPVSDLTEIVVEAL
jgi:heterodisulfide reductase subunit B